MNLFFNNRQIFIVIEKMDSKEPVIFPTQSRNKFDSFERLLTAISQKKKIESFESAMGSGEIVFDLVSKRKK